MQYKPPFLPEETHEKILVSFGAGFILSEYAHLFSQDTLALAVGYGIAALLPLGIAYTFERGMRSAQANAEKSLQEYCNLEKKLLSSHES